MAFRYRNIIGTMSNNYNLRPLVFPFSPDGPFLLIIDHPHDIKCNVCPLLMIADDPEWNLSKAPQIHIVKIMRQPQYYEIGPSFKNCIGFFLESTA